MDVRRMVTIGVFMVGLAVALAGCCAFSAPRYRGPVSDHFDGEEFFNQNPNTMKHGFGDMVKWQLNREEGPWKRDLTLPYGPKPLERVGIGEMRVTFINHASVLIQMDGLNILTDPIWSDRTSPVSWAGPKRMRPAGIRFEDLPPIDAVVVSHNHYDHLDIPSLRRLAEVHKPRIFAGLGNSLLLNEEEVPGGEDVDWWQRVALNEQVQLVSVPTQHWSNRGMCDRNGTLWSGYVIEGPSGRAYYAGDTGFGPHFAQIRERLGPMRLAVLPIGAYLPRWFMKDAHIGPDEAIRAAQLLEAGTAVGVHFGTFKLADDGQDQPPQDLALAMQKAGVAPERFWVLGFGEGRDVPPLAAPLEPSPTP